MKTLPSNDTVSVPTSTGKRRYFYKYAFASFTLKGDDRKLLLLKPADEPEPDHLSIFFRDQTSGQETYGGGRCLNIDYPLKKNWVEIDFNKAYNPYCAYNEVYDCPLPPAENRLKVSIEAGEKTYFDEKRYD